MGIKKANKCGAAILEFMNRLTSPTIESSTNKPLFSTKTQTWLPIREELKLEKGPLTKDGSPTWTIHDPIANRFFRIGWLEFEILGRWGLADSEKIVSSILKTTTINTDISSVEHFFQFLLVNDLLVQSSISSSAYYAKKQKSLRKNLFLKILTNYLYFRIPLVRPDAFLKATLPFTQWIFSFSFLSLIFLIAILGFYLAIGQWSHFVNGFDFLTTPSGAVFFIAALCFSKCCHEMGHGYAAVKYGCSVPTMGIGMILFFPILWTDTTDAWRIKERNQRLVISAAGIYAEIIIAAISTLFWAFLQDGPFRSAVQMLAASTWILTLAVNLNPLMKFDGYFLMSDFLEIPNLQSRSFAIARWLFRNLFFGFRMPPPEFLLNDVIKVMIIYSVSVWIYRFFLYLSIALTIYLYFFKILGLMLMVVQIMMYLIPMVVEMKFLWKNRGQIRWIPNFILTLILIFSLLAFFLFPLPNNILPLKSIFPLQSSITAPAILKAQREVVIYSPSAGKIAQIRIRNNQRVKKGDLMILLKSPEIEHNIAQTYRKINQILIEMERNQSHEKLIEHNVVRLEEYNSLMAHLNGYLEDEKKLSIKAPFDGTITDMQDYIKLYDWIPEKEMLGLIIQGEKQGGKNTVIAFIRDVNLTEIKEGQRVKFYHDGFIEHSFTGTVNSIDHSAVQKLIYPEIASLFGGRLPVQKDENGNLVPVESAYKVNIAPDNVLNDMKSVCTVESEKIMTGRVKIYTQPTSLFTKFWIHAVGVFIRESGL